MRLLPIRNCGLNVCGGDSQGTEGLMKPIRLLLVENEEADAQAFRDAFAGLSDRFHLTVSGGLVEAFRELSDRHPDIVVAGMDLPDGKGTDLLVTQTGPLSLPLVVISNKGEVEEAVKALKEGALDYVVKSPRTFTNMPRIVNRVLREWDRAVQREKAEQALLEESQRCREFLYIAEVVVISVDSSGKVKFVNEKGVELLGRPREEIVGQDWIAAFLPERHREYARKAISLVMAGEQPLPAYTENLIMTGSGVEKLLAWRSTLLSESTGGITGILSLGVDITERKLAENKLKESEERFRAVFEGAQDCIIIKDTSLRYTHVNPAFCRLLGLESHEIVGRRAEDLFGDEIGRQVLERSARVLEGESIELEQTRIVRGHALTFHDTISPLKDDNGRIVGLCYVSRDITERKHVTEDSRVQPHDYPSPAMRQTMEKAGVAAGNDSTVLLQGESGSGKDFLARWIHERSRRSTGPFFAVNCAAVPRELAESELFGHERGAFTGAHRLKKGLLELAEGGTILFNEVGELDISLQAKLLAFLDTRSFLRVGGQKHVYVNARLIAASHRELRKEVQQERFLAPLYYRLSVFPIDVPSLRERRQDLRILAEDLIRKLATELQLPQIPTLDSRVMRDLTQYEWPGNVRELRNVLERSLILWRKGPFHLELPHCETCSDEWSYTVYHDPDQTFHHILEGVGIALCTRALRVCQGNKKEAARLLQVSRETLYRYIRKLSCEPKK